MSIHDAASGEQVIAFPELPGRVIAIAVNPDGKKVASIMQFYDAETSRTVRQISIHDAISGNRQLVRDLPGGGSAGHLEFSPNGKLLIAVKGQLREPIDVLDAQTCRPL